MRVWGLGSSSGNPLDLSGERSDLACGCLATRHFRDKPSGAGGICKNDTLANARGESRRLMFSHCLGDLACNECAGTATVQDEPRNKLRTEALRLVKQPQCLGRSPAVERRWLRRHQRQIGCEHRGANKCCDPGRSIDHHMIDVAGDLTGLNMERIAGEREHIEQPRQPSLGALLRPVERRALRVRVDDHEALALRSPGSGHMQRQGGLADAALVVEERNDHGASPERTTSHKLLARLIVTRSWHGPKRSDLHSCWLTGRKRWFAMVEPKWSSATIGR